MTLPLPADLRVLWSRPYPRARAEHDGERAGSLFLQAVGDSLEAVDIATGDVRWTLELNAMLVAASDDVVAAVPRRSTFGPHDLVGSSTRTGETLWRRPLGASALGGRPANHTRSGLLRAGGRSWFRVDRFQGNAGPFVVAIDLTTGELSDPQPAPPGSLAPVGSDHGLFARTFNRPFVWWFDGATVRELPVGSQATYVCVDGDRLVTWHKAERVHRVWALPSGDFVAEVAGDGLTVAIEDDTLATSDGTDVVLWSLSDGRERWRVNPNRAQAECTFLGAYVVNAVAVGHLLRRDTGQTVIATQYMHAPRRYDDAVLWVFDSTLHRLDVAGSR